MNELTITLAIVSPIITYLIGRYFGTPSQKNYKNLEQARDYWKDSNERRWQRIKELEIQVRDLSTWNVSLEVQNQELSTQANDWRIKFANAPKFQLVVNKDKHPAANDNYLYVEGQLNGKREAGLFTLNDWGEAKERLLKNPEDKP